MRFSNDGRKTYRKVEAHLAYEVVDPSPTQVTFGWKSAAGDLQTATHAYAGKVGSGLNPKKLKPYVALFEKNETKRPVCRGEIDEEAEKRTRRGIDVHRVALGRRGFWILDIPVSCAL